ncbi:MAG: hypothetical protein IKI38_04295 [Mogibacterium sp.]|nr:hypothetical protein [Mogibacterium sp.]
MVTKNYISRGVGLSIPLELQLFIWRCMENLPELHDDVQIFELKQKGKLQRITHRTVEPDYRRNYVLSLEEPITQKIYVVKQKDFSTMLLASEA